MRKYDFVFSRIKAGWVGHEDGLSCQLADDCHGDKGAAVPLTGRPDPLGVQDAKRQTAGDAKGLQQIEAAQGEPVQHVFINQTSAGAVNLERSLHRFAVVAFGLQLARPLIFFISPSLNLLHDLCHGHMDELHPRALTQKIRVGGPADQPVGLARHAQPHPMKFTARFRYAD